MRILIADDDPVSLRILDSILRKWGYDVLAVAEGEAAWEALSTGDVRLAILDWVMPGIDGVELCRRVRLQPASSYIYLILLTGRGGKEELVEGLTAGADDYITKPFHRDELRSRLKVGERVVQLESTLAKKVDELKTALARVRQLQGLLPICSYCKKVRDDRNYWHQVEAYVTKHSGAAFSHTVCPNCYERYVRPMLEGKDTGEPEVEFPVDEDGDLELEDSDLQVCEEADAGDCHH